MEASSGIYEADFCHQQFAQLVLEIEDGSVLSAVEMELCAAFLTSPLWDVQKKLFSCYSNFEFQPVSLFSFFFLI